jgi:hypothetical protein
LFAAYFLEAGFILSAAPWSSVWERNRFIESRPALRTTVESPYFRGAVTGVGVITALAGLVELAGVVTARSRRSTDPTPGETPKPQAG